MHCIDRTCRGTRNQGVDVKELNLEEVLRIAGGLPVAAALDEITYRVPDEATHEPVDYARIPDCASRTPEPN
jgi:hypothetical protein